ncbi:MAG: alpha/beta hydrolase [Chloroflexota bacterium]|nr:alpha/beta hydrolase [Chloroflexota bacterium]
MASRVLAAVLAVGMGAGTVAAQSQSPALPYTPHRIVSSDGTALAVQEWGNRSGPAILFIHGSWQSHLSWVRQVEDPALLREFRLVTFDLRGHGASDKPVGDAFYKPAKPWADDVAAIIAALDLRRPTVVAWSYGGRVVGDYLTVHGSRGLGAINFVAATTSSAQREFFGPGVATLGPGSSEDLATMIRGTIDFLRACFERQPDEAQFQTILAYTMATPRTTRVGMAGRVAAYEPVLRALDLPVLVTQGERDPLIMPALSRWTASVVPGAVLSLYEGVGHSPFFEDAERFNRELAELARRARRE